MRKTSRGRRAGLALAALSLVAVSCGDDNGSSRDTTEESPDTDVPDTAAPDTTDAAETTDAPATTAAPTTVAPTTTVPASTLPPVTLPATTAPPVTTPDEPADVGVLFEDFDDDTNQWTPEALDDEFATGEIADGFMSFSQSASFLDTLPEGQTAVPLLVWPSVLDEQAAELTDVRFETALVMTRGASAGLACGIDPTGADERFYAFTISSSGVVAIQKFAADGTFNNVARLPNVPAGAEPALPTDPAFDYSPESLYTVTAECLLGGDAAQLSLELDGEVLLTFEDADAPIPSGTVGVQYSESSVINVVEGFQPFSVVFDTFIAFDLDAGTGAPAAAGDFQSTCTDEAGDFIDDKGNSIEIDGPAGFGIDLAEVVLDAEDGVMTVVWFLNGPPPASSDETGRDRAIFWSVGINGEDEFIEIRVILDGTEVTSAAHNNLADVRTVDLTDHVIISGDTVAVDVPLDEVEIPADFTWTAFAQISGSEQDVCPSDFGSLAVSTS